MAKTLLDDIQRLLETTENLQLFLKKVAKSINQFYSHYTWVGFYFLEEDGKLHVGPYIGKPTPHNVIDLNKGICGAAVSQKQTIVVDDVNADPRYLACSLETKSEIVIPIWVGGQIIGELDIDSIERAAFSRENKRELEAVIRLIEKRLEREQ
jgi:GAF domain-containing protein